MLCRVECVAAALRLYVKTRAGFLPSVAWPLAIEVKTVLPSEGCPSVRNITKRAQPVVVAGLAVKRENAKSIAGPKTVPPPTGHALN